MNYKLLKWWGGETVGFVSCMWGFTPFSLPFFSSHWIPESGSLSAPLTSPAGGQQSSGWQTKSRIADSSLWAHPGSTCTKPWGERGERWASLSRHIPFTHGGVRGCGARTCVPSSPDTLRPFSSLVCRFSMIRRATLCGNCCMWAGGREVTGSASIPFCPRWAFPSTQRYNGPEFPTGSIISALVFSYHPLTPSLLNGRIHHARGGRGTPSEPL